MKDGKVYETAFTTWPESVSKLMEAADFADVFKRSKKNFILVKPNLVSAAPPPVTTPFELVEAILNILQEMLPGVRLVIGEGTGMKEYETECPFKELGYRDLADKSGVELIDLNQAELVDLADDSCKRWPEMHLPKIVMDAFLFSVPVLKAHSLAEVTLTMKNMIGAAPPRFYDSGSWKKSAFHHDVHNAVFDLNKYRMPDFSIIDATLGMSEAHLWGPTCDPAPNLLAASDDPVAIDAWGCRILGRNWQKILHISLADGILGNADAETVIV